MTILPKNKSDLLLFLHTHAPIWQARAAELGLSAAQAQSVVDAEAEARARFNAASQAREAALAATLAADLALRAAHAAAAAAVRIIKNTAMVGAGDGGGDGVYAQAEIAPPARARPGTMPAPAQPVELRAALVSGGQGALEIAWRCTHPANSRGVVYIVRRKLPGESAFTVLATVGGKRFVDDRLPAESAQGEVQYTVQAQRGDRKGPVSASLNVAFGRVQTVESIDRVRMAA